MWTRTVVTYSDNKSTTAYSVARQGATGPQGASGTSVTVKSTSVTYAVTGSNSQPADSAFTSTTMPSVGVGQYLWSKATTVFSDNKSITSYSVSRIGTDGKTGSTGASGKTTHFAYSTSADGKSDFNTSLFSGATYIGTYDDTTTADSTDPTKYKWTKLKGDTGPQGPRGPAGADGISVASVVIQYYLSTSSTSMAGGSWSTDYPKWEPNKWVWIRQETTLSDGTKKYSDGKLWSNLNELYELETSNRAEIVNTNDAINTTVEQVTKYHSELSDAIKSNTDALDNFKSDVSGMYATKSEIAQTSQSIQASIKKTISDSTYQTVSSIKLDEDGLHVGTSKTQTESKIDGSGLTVSDADGNMLMNVTTAQSMIQNLKVTEKVQFGAHQIQAYSGEEADGSTVVGTAFLWIGDVK